MCLKARLKMTDAVAEIKEGWKVFRVDVREELYFGFSNERCPRNVWVEPTNKGEKIRIWCDGISKDVYPAGFHVFVSAEAARVWAKGEDAECAIRKVKVKGITTYGTQDGRYLKDGLVIVCKQIYVPAGKGEEV